MNRIASSLKLYWRKRWVRILLVLFLVGTLLFAFRYPLLRGVGGYLNAADSLEPSQAFFILGGNSYDRGRKAYEVFTYYPTAQFVATGGNFPLQIQALGINIKETELTRIWLIKQGVPEAQIDTLGGSTSTFEESEEILNYCKERGLTDITLISSSYHLRRMRMVFEKRFREEGILTRYIGAGDEEFNADEWWRDERSLINVNNELVKIVYYRLKY